MVEISLIHFLMEFCNNSPSKTFATLNFPCRSNNQKKKVRDICSWLLTVIFSFFSLPHSILEKKKFFEEFFSIRNFLPRVIFCFS